MSVSRPTSSDYWESETGDCEGCDRTFHLDDLIIKKVGNPASQVEANPDLPETFYEAWCEECERRVAEEFGLSYQAPDELPEPVEGGDVDGDA